MEIDVEHNLKELPTDIATLQKMVYQMHNDYLILQDKYNLLQHQMFGAKSEKLHPEDPNQMQLFNEAEAGAQVVSEKPDEPEVITVKEHTRAKTGRKAIPEDLPREVVVHDLSPEEKKCSCCQKERPCIGQEETEELDIKPAQVKVIKHVRLKYGECTCEQAEMNAEPGVVIAPMPERMIPGSIAGAGLLAYILTGKFCDAIPFYRQENIFKRLNIEISRMNMCNWAIQTGRRCGGLLEMMWEDVRSGPFIQMDETTFQVLHEPERSVQAKSYMWVTIGYQTGKPIVIFHYHPTRSEEVVLHALKEFKGYLQTDGYAGYNKAGSLPGRFHVGCMAHVRRKFMDALKITKKAGSANVALSYIQKIYHHEKILREKKLPDEMFVIERKKLVEPILNDFYKWLNEKKLQVPPQTKIGEAVNYAINEWPKVIRYLEAAFLTPDNNAAENAVRPFVLGWKNWLFNNTPLGAHDERNDL